MKYWFNGVPYQSEVAPDEGGFAYWAEGVPISAIAEVIVLAYLRPTGIDAVGGWVNSTGGPATADPIDEAVQDDADYIQSPFITDGDGIWDTVTYEEYMTFADGNRVAIGHPTEWDEAYSEVSHTSGKYYFEVKPTIANDPYVTSWEYGHIGVISDPYGAYVYLEYIDYGYINTNSTTIGGPVGYFSTGDTVAVAVDIGLNKVWFRRNNLSWLPAGSDPAAGTGGYTVQGGNLSDGGGAHVNVALTDASARLNTGPSFEYAVPAGFAPWYVNPSPTDICRINFGATGSQLDGDKTIRVGYAIAGPDLTLTVRLLQGTTEITSWTHTDLTDTPQLFTQTLTTPEREAIDWDSQNTLKLEFEAN